MNFNDFGIREWGLLGSAIFDLIAAGCLIYIAFCLIYIALKLKGEIKGEIDE